MKVPRTSHDALETSNETTRDSANESAEPSEIREAVTRSEEHVAKVLERAGFSVISFSNSAELLASLMARPKSHAHEGNS